VQQYPIVEAKHTMSVSVSSPKNTSLKHSNYTGDSLRVSPASTIASGSIEDYSDQEEGEEGGAMGPLREPEQSARRRVQVIAFCSAMLNW